MQAAVSDQGTVERALRRSAADRFCSLVLCPPGEGFAAVSTAAAWRTTLEAARMAGERTAAADDLDLTPSTAVSPPESDLSGCGVGRCPLEPSA